MAENKGPPKDRGLLSEGTKSASMQKIKTVDVAKGTQSANMQGVPPSKTGPKTPAPSSTPTHKQK